MMRAAYAVAVATTIASGTAAGQLPWSVSGGVDLLSARYARGSATSIAVGRRLGSIRQTSSVDLTANLVRGSGDYSMFNCHVARQIYCFGGSERLTAGDLMLQFTGEPFKYRLLGFSVSPVASFGVNRSRSEVTETEGPTTLCFSSTGELISCADNPPFRNFHATEWATLPSYSYGLGLSRRVGRVELLTGASFHRAGLFDRRGHERLRLNVGISF